MLSDPGFVTLAAFRIVGIERFTSNGPQAIQEAWQELERRASEVRHQRVPEVRYGFEDYSRDFTMTPGAFPKFYYLAAVEVTALEDIPEGMKGKEVPAARYAMFTHRGPKAGVAELFRHIYDTWLPASGYVPDPKVQADFERYAERVTDPSNITSEIYIPIVAK